MDKSVQQVVTDALRLAGQLWTPGGGPSPEAIAEVTEFLNQMLDSWNTMRNSIFAMTDLTFSMTSGTYIYTIGPGGMFNGPRPQRIESMDLIYQLMPNLYRLPIRMIDQQEWAAIRVPNLPEAVPFKCYYDNGYSETTPTGLGTLYFWPGPMSGFEVEMWIWGTLPATLLSTDTLFLPPGYARAITYNLAIEIMALYPKRLNEMRASAVAKIAKESRDWVNALNAPMPDAPMPSELMANRGRSNFNWLASTN
jgi:hypothetical protein